ncbi:2,3-diaminopropionate biosynthesis protein SbnA [Actinoplanes sp. L3-i22]|uniref:2,3-diaminopropionate biosynthesis protein SbnA n=1 Tax=Actinoplanes sp. L3-i22 TaxID=2836373 RepID=UPI001C77ECBE|nr:2,3-diaminopropionate biosynthesis protein SbnA [Actinoplanes sp. L3-i22]BCY14203.1 hypothetical protein L3i22_092910 [Actinoplanes sp. L3-i22]
MIADHAYQLGDSRAFLRLPGFQERFDTILKVEGLNTAGSVKIKTAREMVLSALARGELRAGMHLIESTSGNLGVALASICAAEHIRLTIVTDPNVNAASARCIEALGAEVVTVTERDRNGGFLQTRIDYITGRLADDSRMVWLNQYVNPANPRAHQSTTAREIESEFGAPDWVFVGVGSTGTLMGCLAHFRAIEAPTRMVGVDTVGSVTFGGLPGPRWIPGLGSSRRPEIFSDDGDFAKCTVPEADTVRICRRIAREHGLLIGGSTGTVLAAVAAMQDRIMTGSQVVVISPDLGERYLDTIYNDRWVIDRYGPDLMHAIEDDVRVSVDR